MQKYIRRQPPVKAIRYNYDEPQEILEFLTTNNISYSFIDVQSSTNDGKKYVYFKILDRRGEKVICTLHSDKWLVEDPDKGWITLYDEAFEELYKKAPNRKSRM